MQSFNSKDELIKSGFFETYEEARAAAEAELEKPEISFVAVGKFPSMGEKITVNGLRCQVIMSNSRKKRFTLKIL